MIKVAMFVTNPCTHDARVMKEAKSLSDHGFDVRIFALSNADNPEGVYKQQNYTIHRLKYDSIFVRGRHAVWRVISVILFPLYILKIAFVWIFQKLLPGFKRTKLNLVDVCFLGWKRLRTSQSPGNYSDRVDSGEELTIIRIVKWLGIRIYFMIRKLRGLFSWVRNFLIKKINRVIYVVFLPIHKFTTYYFFCKEASVEACLWSPDIAHAHDLNTMYAGKLVKAQTGAKLIYDSHELWIHRNRVNRKATVEKMIDKFAERILIRQSDAIITVCDSIGDWLVNRYPHISKPIILRNIPYALESDLKGSLGTPTGLKARMGLLNEDVLMIYTGKFTSGRGIKFGLEATKNTENLHFALLGYGEPNYVNELQKIVKELDISDRVTFFDPVPHDKVTEFISGSDFALVYIEPICLSYEFALPNKLFESIQAGIPILGYSLAEIRKIVEKYRVGLCFNSPESFKSTLQSVTPTRIALWRKNIDACKSDLCWEIESQKLLNLYAGLE